ncbi:hypothetical protein D8674_011911 [Pyrus ussuriensis x Pyrus communis]|uniref:RNase H type-1 domain-containing protein n=1 Tax=Pyrus ussuriensis x Pyrus communis TaxID=2448454 RepID=A0A5N5G063_9ROSA|nr:hypothetical protein D8674_011911 [Pyrus ussuriensis x Pyrus communis]
MVDALIDSEFFNEEEGTIILRLPVSLMGCPDRLIWHYFNNGSYTVRTGYGVAIEMEENGKLGRKETGAGMLLGREVRHGKLQRPLFGVMKINYDGAWCGKTCKGGYGCVLRDFVGLLQAAGGEGGVFFNLATMAEAAAIRAILRVCIKLGCADVEIESDSQVLIRMLTGEYVIDAALECFIHDIGLLRSGNVAAHVVASHGAVFHWDSIGPKFLFNIVAQDVNVLVRI